MMGLIKGLYNLRSGWRFHPVCGFEGYLMTLREWKHLALIFSMWEINDIFGSKVNYFSQNLIKNKLGNCFLIFLYLNISTHFLTSYYWIFMNGLITVHVIINLYFSGCYKLLTLIIVHDYRCTKSKTFFKKNTIISWWKMIKLNIIRTK